MGHGTTAHDDGHMLPFLGLLTALPLLPLLPLSPALFFYLQNENKNSVATLLADTTERGATAAQEKQKRKVEALLCLMDSLR